MQVRGTLPVAHDGARKTMMRSVPAGQPPKAKPTGQPGQTGGGSKRTTLPAGYAARKALARMAALKGCQ